MPACVKDQNLMNKEGYDYHDSEIVLYADDSTSTTSHRNPDMLQQNIQCDANLSTQWIRDNQLVCSGQKTKLLIVGTAANRRNKLLRPNNVISIQVCRETVQETACEKLIGVIVNNNATWKEHLNGVKNDEENINEPGLIKDLSKRVGLLKHIRKYLSDKKFDMICNGIFYSKLIYCISVWGGVWNIPGILDDKRRCNPAITLENHRRLQVLQNVVLRLKTRMGMDTPVKTLLYEAKQLSVQQLAAYHSMLSVYKCKLSKQPEYMYRRLFPDRNDNGILRYNLIQIDYKLSLARSSFFYRASTIIWNALECDAKMASSVQKFKVLTKKWIKNNISECPYN